MTWTPSTPSSPPGSGRPTPTSARSTGSSPPPTPESSSATYTQTLSRDGLLAGIREVGAPVEMIDLSEPRPLAPDEVLVEVAAAGVGNWDEFFRTGGWDVGGG